MSDLSPGWVDLVALLYLMAVYPHCTSCGKCSGGKTENKTQKQA